MWEDVLSYVAIGFAAQMIDGALGMAYGVTSTSAMLAIGIPPATASACVHAAETFTTAASGASHWRLGNVDKNLVWRLAIPGMIGGALGAYLLGSVLDGNAIKPYVFAYLLILGIFILFKAFRKRVSDAPPPSQVAPLGSTRAMPLAPSACPSSSSPSPSLACSSLPSALNFGPSSPASSLAEFSLHRSRLTPPSTFRRRC
jgi:uncharacterized membrane protein YfcA